VLDVSAYLRIKRLDPGNGQVLWEYHQERGRWTRSLITMKSNWCSRRRFWCCVFFMVTSCVGFQKSQPPGRTIQLATKDFSAN